MYFIFFSHCGMLVVFRGGAPRFGYAYCGRRRSIHTFRHMDRHDSSYLFSKCRWEGRVSASPTGIFGSCHISRFPHIEYAGGRPGRWE